jgi:hypothetical protein
MSVNKYSENTIGFVDMCFKMINEVDAHKMTRITMTFGHFGGEEIKDVGMIKSPPFSKLSVKLDTRIKNG